MSKPTVDTSFDMDEYVAGCQRAAESGVTPWHELGAYTGRKDTWDETLLYTVGAISFVSFVVVPIVCGIVWLLKGGAW
jgi:hypothetical protein